MGSEVPGSGGAAPAQRRPEIVSLTTLRGLLAVWVVTLHFRPDLGHLLPWADGLAPFFRRGGMAVPGFFVLSGFVLAYNYADRFRTLRWAGVLRFLALRLARIYPVHLVTLLMVALMVWGGRQLGYQLTDAGYTAHDFVLNLLLAQTWVPEFHLTWNYPSWSISSEWFAYLLFPFGAAWVLRRLTTPVRAVAFGLASLAGSIALVCFWRTGPFSALLPVIPAFSAGTAIYCALRGRSPASEPVAPWLPGLFVLTIGAASYLPSPPLRDAVLLCLIFGLIATLARNGETGSAFWSARPAVFLGEISYSLYMTHTLAQKVLYRLLPSKNYASSDELVRLGVAGAYVAVIAGFCLALYFLVEKPCRSLFKNLLSRRPQAYPAVPEAPSVELVQS